MNLIAHIQQQFTAFIQNTYFKDGASFACDTKLMLNTDDQKKDFGDLNSTVALALAKELKMNPRAIASTISQNFTHDDIDRIEIAGPGFINIFLKLSAWQEIARSLYQEKGQFFTKDVHTPTYRYNIEFVSANPTGPLHIGHGRGGIIGDVLANVVRFVGHQVTREYYINDAGSQIKKLGASLKARCQQKAELTIEFPDDGYAGDYLIELAQKCIDQYGVAVLGESDTFFQAYAQENLLGMIKDTLIKYGINFDNWFSEKQLHQSGAIDAVLKSLQDSGNLCEKEGALWFKSTAFDDDKDRVMRKSSGELTYISADAAYLKNKVDRGFDHIITILGHDHHSYVVRLQGLLRALKLDAKAKLDIILYQLVSIKEGGQQLRMSKRTGKMVTLNDIITAVGTDIARFFYLNRKADAQLEFDIDLALKKTDENPVYYVQYAYVRTKSILRKAAEHAALQGVSVKDAEHLSVHEIFILKKIISLKAILEGISTHYQTHQLTYYLMELAHAFHRYYSAHRVIDLANPEQSRGRLLLVELLRNNFELVLTLLEISKPEQM